MDPHQQRNSVPVRSTNPERATVAQPTAYQQPARQSTNSIRQPNAIGKKAIIIGAIVAIVALGGLIGASAYGILPLGGEQQSVVKDKYQAVFLTNGQVYFGKINKISENSVFLKDIYYLQQQSQEPQDQKDPAKATNAANTSLAKLGNELHGPEDAMYISRDQVLFWENLKSDGKVSKAIADYKKQ